MYFDFFILKQLDNMISGKAKKHINGLCQLIFPASCVCCGRSLVESERHICTYCINDLPKTHYHRQKNNPLERKFYGKGIAIEGVWAYYFFNKGGKARKLIHQFKYEGKKEIGFMIGRWYGYELKRQVPKLPFDSIVPVPLHKKKLYHRGFNQSKVFGDGLAVELQLPVEELLEKKLDISSQTAKTRLDRWINSRSAYTLNPASEIKGKRILLIDDILTTGSTLEACARVLLEHGAKRIHILVMAAGQ